jgi:hypothetical protein
LNVGEEKFDNLKLLMSLKDVLGGLVFIESYCEVGKRRGLLERMTRYRKVAGVRVSWKKSIIT